MGHASLARRLKALPRWTFARARAAIAAAEQPKLWLIALCVGVLSGGAAVGFVLALDEINRFVYGASDRHLAAAAAQAPWLLLVIAPAFGGLLVGLLMRFGCDGAAPMGVADVIEARALRHARIDPKRGVCSTVAAALSLGFGASGGREGPAVVAGAAIAAWISKLLSIRPMSARTILGCAVAAAVSASFNAPIAGALFALEVVLGHYAVRAFAPITIASVAGALIGRAQFGDTPAFEFAEPQFGSYAQFPAFFLLGLVCAFAAIAMMWSLFFTREVIDRVARHFELPVWTLPALAGLVIGAISIFFPHVISVGYHTTSRALAGDLGFWTCVIFAVAKTAAVAITIGGRFAGGVFSPALMLGALTGCAFGVVATDIFPSVSGSHALYALAGMGAVAGAVLGAPISTTLIVFELTGDYGTAIAVMVSTSVATVATQHFYKKSFFHSQLSRRALDLSSGPQTFLLPTMRVAASMRARGDEGGASETAAWELVEQGVSVGPDETLARAFPMFRQGRLAFLPVVEAKAEGQGRTLIGSLHYVDALRAYNRALVEIHEEEHS